MALANKYRPKTWDDVTEQSLVVTMLKSLCESDNMDNRNFLLIGPAGTGKAQPLYSKILTPEGYIRMEDVRVGTKVFTHTGAVASVSAIYPQGERAIYEITLQDRTKIRVSDEHLNVVYRYNEDRKCREDFTLTTTELINLFETSRFKLRIDIPEVDWSESEVPIDPYLLGILIADGSLHNNFQLSNPEEDICAKVDSKLREIGWYLKEGKVDHDMCLLDVDHSSRSVSLFKQKLDELGMLVKSVDKHIPSQYLLNSKKVRLQLLQGLFDGDGHIQEGGTVEFTTCSPRLSDDFAFLVRSLGIRDTVSVAPASYRDAQGNKVECHIAYTHHLKVPNGLPFYSSTKHSNKYKDRQNAPMRNIVSIEYVGMEQCQCIMVDHPDHTYLSDDMIPTHNTTTARIMANVINGGRGEPIEIDAASHNGVDSVREIVQQARAYPVGCDYKVFIMDEVHAFSQAAWQVLLKTLEEGPAKSVFVMCTTNPEKIPATILSRVQTFQLSKISLDGIFNRLIHVLTKENDEGKKIMYTDEAVYYIAKLANGGMRDALTLLDKALAYSNSITSENLEKALNLPNYDDYFALLSAYAKKDNKCISTIVHTVYNSGVNFVKWFEGFHAFVINIVKYIFLQDIDATMIPSHYADKISKYTSAHSAVCLKLANKLVKLNHELKSTQYLQELALTYLCAVPTKKG